MTEKILFGMKISHEKPPIYDTLAEAFGISWDEGIVITYGDTLHTKEGNNITNDLVAHEKTHTRQQYLRGIGQWWHEYISDPEFRLRQEIEAYQNQWNFLKQNENDREKLFRKKIRMAQHLSGPIYGNLLTHNEALKAITIWKE